MRFKILLLLLLAPMMFLMSTNSSMALSSNDITGEEYLIHHGHSKDIVRMINLQKERTEGKTTVSSRSQSPTKKFMKNIWFEKDITLPTVDLGYSDIQTPETAKFNFPEIPVKNILFWRNKQPVVRDTYKEQPVEEIKENSQPQNADKL